jgi:outer membrane lipoprotein-sorting protein
MNFPAKLVFSMLIALLALVPQRAFAGPVEDALSSFERLESYKVTLQSNSGEVIRYFFKKPGYIRMEFEQPHKGAVLVYDPFKKEVLLRPFGFLKSLEMRMGPDDRLIRSSGGHTVDESDIGSLLKNVKKLKDNGTVAVAGEEEVGGRKTLLVEVRGEGSFEVDGTNRYRLWLEKTLMLPVKVEAYSASGELLEGVHMDDLEVDPALSNDLFTF